MGNNQPLALGQQVQFLANCQMHNGILRKIEPTVCEVELWAWNPRTRANELQVVFIHPGQLKARMPRKGKTDGSK